MEAGAKRVVVERIHLARGRELKIYRTWTPPTPDKMLPTWGWEVYFALFLAIRKIRVIA